jgi:hypothetical protein
MPTDQSIALPWARMFCFAFLGLLLFISIAQADPVRVPGYSAYLKPNPEPEGMSVSPPAGVTGWADSKTTLVWYGELKATGPLSLSLSIHLPPGEKCRWKLTAAGQSRSTEATGGADPITVSFGSVQISAAGSYHFALEGLTKTGPTFGAIDALLLDGPAAGGAHFSQAETRGAPSVHLWYPTPKDAKITWFYNELTVKSSPLWSYFMACGFARGYFGIQVNSPTERRIIFSVWDAGDEPTDRSKVAEDDKVQLRGKGLGVYTDSFGHEGTGGHSHLVYPWKTGQTYKFLVSAAPDGTGTIYSGYFYFPDRKGWGLIASFRAPKDGGYLRGLYSFNEDFNGANGDERRLAEFGPQWFKTADSPWAELRTAHFTHTKDGIHERFDRVGGIAHDRFYLANGGFVPTENVKYGDVFTRPATHLPSPNMALPPMAMP